MSDKMNILWEAWYNILNCDGAFLNVGQVNVVASTIEKAIAKVQEAEPTEPRAVYKIEDKGFILE